MNYTEVRHKERCPECGHEYTLIIPHFDELVAVSKAEAITEEESAKEELRRLKLWLMSVSILGIIKWWFREKSTKSRLYIPLTHP